MIFRLFKKWISFSLTAALASWCSIATGQPKPMVVSINANIGIYWPQLTANEHRNISKESVDFEMILVGNAAQQLQQLVGGSIDVAYTNCDLAIRAKDKGGDVVIVGGAVNVYPFTIMSAPDVHTPQDLVGKKAILPFKTSLLTVFLNQWLEENGVNPADVDQVFDGATPNRYAALSNGIVSAAVVSQPFDFRAKEEGFNQYFSYPELGEYAFTCAVVNRKWAQNNADRLRAHLQVMADVTEWLYDPANRDAAISLLAEVSKQSVSLVEQTYDYYFNDIKPFSRGMAISQVGLQKLLDVLKEIGDVNAKWNPEDFVDTSYLP